MKTSIRIANALTEIRTQHLLTITEAMDRCANRTVMNTRPLP
jgi:hypothetical protein